MDSYETSSDNSKFRWRREHSHWNVVWGCATLKTPLFRPFFSSGDSLFQAFFQLQRPHFYFSKKILHFQDQFLPILVKFQLLRHKFYQKFVPETRVSCQKISSGDPTFENLGGTYLPKFLSTTSPGVLIKSEVRYIWLSTNIHVTSRHVMSRHVTSR